MEATGKLRVTMTLGAEGREGGSGEREGERECRGMEREGRKKGGRGREGDVHVGGSEGQGTVGRREGKREKEVRKRGREG